MDEEEHARLIDVHNQQVQVIVDLAIALEQAQEQTRQLREQLERYRWQRLVAEARRARREAGARGIMYYDLPQD